MSKGLEALKRITLKDFILNDDSSLKDVKIIEKELKALEIIKDLVYVDVNNQVRLKPENKTLTATESLDIEKAILLKEVLL